MTVARADMLPSAHEEEGGRSAWRRAAAPRCVVDALWLTASLGRVCGACLQPVWCAPVWSVHLSVSVPAFVWQGATFAPTSRVSCPDSWYLADLRRRQVCGVMRAVCVCYVCVPIPRGLKCACVLVSVDELVVGCPPFQHQYVYEVFLEEVHFLAGGVTRHFYKNTHASFFTTQSLLPLTGAHSLLAHKESVGHRLGGQWVCAARHKQRWQFWQRSMRSSRGCSDSSLGEAPLGAITTLYTRTFTSGGRYAYAIKEHTAASKASLPASQEAPHEASASVQASSWLSLMSGPGPCLFSSKYGHVTIVEKLFAAAEYPPATTYSFASCLHCLHAWVSACLRVLTEFLGQQS